MRLHVTRRATLHGLAAAALLASGMAHAQGDYPAKPVRLVVPYAPGGFSDIVARTIAPALQKRWGQSVVIDNRAGANGVIGTSAVAQAAPDGYTLLLALDSHASNHSLLKSLPYDSIRSFAPVTFLGTAPMVLVANTQFAPNTVPELVKAAKAAPDSIAYGSLGPGSQIQMAARMLENSTGIRMTGVSYKGGALALTDLMGGHIQLLFASATSAAPYLQQAKLKALGVASAKRLPMLPDVPTIAEQGVPGVEMGFWVGVLAPAATPEPIVAKLNQSFTAAVTEPDVAKRLHELGLQVSLKGPAEFGSFLPTEIARWAEMLKRENVKPTD